VGISCQRSWPTTQRHPYFRLPTRAVPSYFHEQVVHEWSLPELDPPMSRDRAEHPKDPILVWAYVDRRLPLAARVLPQELPLVFWPPIPVGVGWDLRTTIFGLQEQPARIFIHVDIILRTGEPLPKTPSLNAWTSPTIFFSWLSLTFLRDPRLGVSLALLAPQSHVWALRVPSAPAWPPDGRAAAGSVTERNTLLRDQQPQRPRARPALSARPPTSSARRVHASDDLETGWR
jgi:hypothetical protein